MDREQVTGREAGVREVGVARSRGLGEGAWRGVGRKSVDFLSLVEGVTASAPWLGAKT